MTDHWYRHHRVESLPTADAVDGFWVYQFQHIDCLGWMMPADEVLRGPEDWRITAALRRRFRLGGWEGDGGFQALWFPPFAVGRNDETCGVLTWHVKQDNNGTSFIASPYKLPFSALGEPVLSGQNIGDAV